MWWIVALSTNTATSGVHRDQPVRSGVRADILARTMRQQVADLQAEDN